MSADFEVTVEQEVAQVAMRRPHVVILGAGASRAACPRGDARGRILPLMADFADVTGLSGLLRSWGMDPAANFEDTFSDLFERGDTDKVTALQEHIKEYFGGVVLPDHPTIYDHLVLSLRETDLIATFNWDPLLIDAYRRSGRAGLKLPKLAFLHGNVRVGFCSAHDVLGLAGNRCSRCGVPFKPSALLYPVKRKDYATDPMIANQWALLKDRMKAAFMITIFGYSGPKTDQEAIAAMKEAWGTVDQRSMEQTAFITRQTEEEISENWSAFIHSHHYEVTDDFYQSWIANHPRRTGEAYINQYLEAKFISDNSIPRNLELEDLWSWYGQFKTAEAAT